MSGAMTNNTKRPQVGVSACLLGETVRYDGGHKANAWILGPLAERFDFVPSCPEVAIGLGVPRLPIQLVGNPERPCLLGVDDPCHEVTHSLEAYARFRVGQLSGLSGYLCKTNSPSCGMRGVNVYPHGGGEPMQTGQGMFIRILMSSFPWLPVEEEGRLKDKGVRKNFVDRVLIYHRWQRFLRSGLSVSGLMGFHRRHQHLINIRSHTSAGELEKLLSHLSTAELNQIALTYVGTLMSLLNRSY